MPDVPAIPHRFLTRNRLIAALSKATVVVEAAFRSGSLRTARDAAEIFRPVMAVPGPINSPTSEGCHRLIIERVAELVSSVSEVMELVRPISIK
jgi:DNA processing protein